MWLQMGAHRVNDLAEYFMRSLNRAGGIGKHGVGIGSDKPDCADNQHQDYGQHHRILGDILALIVPQQAAN
jgi:hypothetical protein